MVRDKESGKSKGFAFLKYEDQRSTDLAVDNLGGSTVMGRILKVDHTRYKRKDDEEELEREKAFSGQNDSKDLDKVGENESDTEAGKSQRPPLKEEIELAALLKNHDEDDPMKDYLIKKKKAEVAEALSKMNKKKQSSSGDRRRHHHHRHRSRRYSDASDKEKKSKQKYRD